MIHKILRLDNEIKENESRLKEDMQDIERLKVKYVKSFHARNPDLATFTFDQVRDFTDLLMIEAENLREPNSVILVAGGVLFIFFGVFSLSILITREFYKEYQIDGLTWDVYLEQARTLIEVGFVSMLDKLGSVSGSVISVLLLKPLIYGHWRTEQETSSVYNVKTVSSSIIAGIASIAGASGNVEIHSSILIGAFGGIIYIYGSLLLDRFQLDDPLEAI